MKKREPRCELRNENRETRNKACPEDFREAKKDEGS